MRPRPRRGFTLGCIVDERTKVGAVRFHDLRHTAATLMLKAGIHPKIVSERLGHSTISITLDTYSHVLPDMQRDAAISLDAVLAAGRWRSRGGERRSPHTLVQIDARSRPWCHQMPSRVTA